MSGPYVRIVAGLWFACSASLATAQVAPPLFYKYSQPWARPLPGFASVVGDCAGAAVAFAPAALDDWICSVSGPIALIRWVGAVPNATATPPKLFFIAVYSQHPTLCRQSGRIYTACVFASARPIGTDCKNRRVFAFAATLPPAEPFIQTANTHYWLQISEVDGVAGQFGASPTVGGVDFEWSSSLPLSLCPALQQLGAAVTQPLSETCSAKVVDLAFSLSSRSITGVISPNPGGPNGCAACPPGPVYTLELRRPADGALIETLCITPDETGRFDAEPDSADGTYRIAIRGMACRTKLIQNVVLADGGVRELGTINLVFGDADNSDTIDFADISRVFASWGL